MRITSIETFPIALPLTKPVKMSHVTIDVSHNVLVKVTTDSGIVGWGEGVPAMDVTGENQGRILASIEDLGSRILGRDPLAPGEVWADLRRTVYGNTTGIGALDIALHDIAGKALGVPVAELIGGVSRSRIPALTLVGSGDPAADLEAFEERYRAGYRWFKLKLGIGDLDHEAQTLVSMAAAHDDAVVCGDTNGGWTEEESARFLAAVVGSPVRFVEQPTMNTDALVRLAEGSSVAICADESARTLDDVAALGKTAVAGVSLKLIKHAGITGVMRGAALCDQVGLEINLAGKIAESAIAATANLHAAAAMSDTGFGCSPGNQTVAADVCTAPPKVVDGFYAVPTAPGLGIEVDEDRVRSLAG
jgi:L-alanine-DL-glutamate epimerase-like enolase superfamily enzyme